MAKKVALEAQKEETRQMEESLRADNEAFAVKVKECSMLETKKQDMLAVEAPKEKFVDEFMDFLQAIDNEDLVTVRRFDEKDMMHTISTMMNNNGGDIRGLVAGLYGDDFNMIGLGIEAKATEDLPADTIVATVKTDGSCGGHNDGNCGIGKTVFAGDFEKEGAMVAAAVGGPNSESIEA